MENPPLPAAGPPGLTITRVLCVVILVLMVGAMVYGAAIAIKYFPRIGV